ncbi:MAG: glutamate formimidoyltransferase [Chloroflexota bacterium]
MISSLVECVPNFSEGRDSGVIDALVAAVRSVDGAHLLDVSSDADHNRTVLTIVGEPDPVADAAFRAVERAADLIDLDRHRGVHPRIGAADVVPFIPLRGYSMSQCVTLARAFGRKVGRELNLPVYLYEQAALRPERENLAYVRMDPYEMLRSSILTNPERQPDYGPARLGKAGAVAVGARGPLIAFNAHLNTADVAAAQRIARRVRTSTGGLPNVKALGFLVEDRAQVSMNLTDFRRTGVHHALEAVRAAARDEGLMVTDTELVGLVPQAALIDAALAYLGLPEATRTLILEQRIGTMTGDYTEVPFE